MDCTTVEFPSTVLGRTVRMKVLVPDRGQRRYPALYLHHGLGGTYAKFCRQTEIAHFVRSLDLIIVMPDAGDGWFCNDPRPGGLAWEDHLAGELVDYVDAHFPTIPARDARGQAGFSMGGYGAVMLGLKHPDRFSLVSCHAASFAFGNRPRPDRPERAAFMQAVAPPGGPYDLWQLAQRTAAGSFPIAIRFDVGRRDHLRQYNRQFHAWLDELEIDHEYQEVEGGHDWDYVNRQLPATVKFAAERLRA